jgi:2-polyprenyl-6-methoxyphenol hydroxylase-like FAD-dependent oxidoreductase
MDTEVLIVGAGPTGLVLALWLAKLGVRVRIVDRAPRSGMSSRAFALQARTLEFYDQLGLAYDAVGRGRVITAMNVHTRGRRVDKIAFGAFGQGLSPFPFVLMLLQDDHEKLLTHHLSEAGVQVERSTELIDIEDRGTVVRARMKGPDGADEYCEAAFVCGCDGAFSAVRELAGIAFPGASSEEVFYVADVQADGPIVDGELHYLSYGEDVCSVFPLKGERRVRLIGIVPRSIRQSQLQISFDDLAPRIEQDAELEVAAVEAFATYSVNQRIAEQWRKGRVFLLGDASHVHSPAGGQGLNAGVGDAVNLAWKLAAVIRGGADVALLDTYQEERRLAARQIAATTDAGFAVQSSRAPLMKMARSVVIMVMPRLMGLGPFRRWAFGAVSQLAISYRRSGSCTGEAGRICGGDRLPWARSDCQSDNFAPGHGIGWQVQVYGEAGESLRTGCARLGLPVHVFAWTPAAESAGFAKDAVYLVRPDGYVAYASAEQDLSAIERQLSRFKIALPAIAAQQGV